jgi:Fungal N-terminal domain of STAND proteins
MDPLSFATSLMGVLQLSQQVVIQIDSISSASKSIDSISSASKSLRHLQADIQSFTMVMRFLVDECENAILRTSSIRKSLEGCLKLSVSLFKEMTEYFSKFSRLASTKSIAQRAYMDMVKIRMTSADINHMAERLNSIKTTLSLILLR